MQISDKTCWNEIPTWGFFQQGNTGHRVLVGLCSLQPQQVFQALPLAQQHLQGEMVTCLNVIDNPSPGL